MEYSPKVYRLKIRLEEDGLLAVFDPREIRCMNRVMEEFKEKGSDEMSNPSHREDAWLKQSDMILSRTIMPKP